MNAFCSTVLGLVVSLTSVSFLTPPAWAIPQHLNLTLNVVQGQTFAELMQQAESLAISSIEQAFATDPGTTDVSISIMGERNGQEVPLLFATVTRMDWQRDPRIQTWMRSMGRSPAILLGLRNTTPSGGVAIAVLPQNIQNALESLRRPRDD